MKARIFVHGFVQGVGFRQFVKKNAKKLNLKGYVQNLSDGRVEAVAQGREVDLRELIKICEKGTFFSDVKSVTVDFEEEENFEDFEIKR